ncbi:hypothetical protein [Saccharopolyspora cebuensis]|uniref:Uncharacterized protein n=1 Tax=Saccharopolyspora cebuensis TaxID=418759 RepID=A0ABV4CI02_9PSEU
MDVIVLSFVTGFALATLIFWPLLHGAKRRLTEAGVIESPPKGRHALRTEAATAPRPAAAPKSAEKEPTAEAAKAEPVADVPRQPEPKADASAAPDREAEPVPPESPAETTQPSEPVPPEAHPEDKGDIPVLPTNLFEEHFEARFNRSRQRLERLRSELNGN